MTVEPNEWRPYGKIIYQKQNFVVKQVAMLPEKAAEYDSAPDYTCCPLQSWQHTDLHQLFDDWRKQFSKSSENGICKRIPCICYPDAMTFRAAYLAGIKHSTFMKAMEENISSGWGAARMVAHDVAIKAMKSKELKEICRATGYPPFVVAALGKALLKFEDGDAMPLVAKFFEELITGILYVPVEKIDELAFKISDKTWEVIDTTEFKY
ncbi:MAG: hypothetical protein HDR30_06775 [Lachnospiraceae bacterium]|nr:hypothetical protein [Lachnospiraceae bacterium]